MQLDQLSRIIVISMNLLSGEYHTCKKEAQDTSAGYSFYFKVGGSVDSIALFARRCVTFGL